MEGILVLSTAEATEGEGDRGLDAINYWCPRRHRLSISNPRQASSPGELGMDDDMVYGRLFLPHTKPQWIRTADSGL